MTRGDQEDFFTTVFNEHHTLVLNLARRILRDHHAAEDIVQEVFLTLHRSLQEGTIIENIPAWLNRSTINAALNEKRDNRTCDTVTLDGQAPKASTGNPCMTADTAEMLQAMTRAVQALPEKQRIVFTLRFMEGRSYHDITDVLGSSLESARKNAERGRKRVYVAIRKLTQA